VVFGENRSLGVVGWLVVPVVFIALVVTVLAGANYLLGHSGQPIELSTLLFGAAAGLTVATSGNVRWPKACMRRRLCCGYPVVVLALGVWADGTQVPVELAGLIGLPAVTAVAAWYFDDRPRRTDHAQRS
jgi:hypothetical protein